MGGGSGLGVRRILGVLCRHCLACFRPLGRETLDLGADLIQFRLGLGRGPVQLVINWRRNSRMGPPILAVSAKGRIVEM